MKQLHFKMMILLMAALMTACSQKLEFKTFPKIDAHVHLETNDDAFVNVVEDYNFKLMTLVTRSAPQPVIDVEFKYAQNLYEKHPQTIAFATTFTMDGFGEPDWEERTINWLKKSFDEGAIAVKVWKDIGMTYRDQDSSFIMIDDKRFDPIWNFIESQNKTLVNHTGEPKNCWLPIDKMTVQGDRSYFAEHPQYHMYLHPEYPLHEDIMAARNRMLDKHPGLRYVGCHLGSLEWDVDEQAKFLDKHPNVSLDMAARIPHFKVQKYERVRAFILKYQDRLLYGTDMHVNDRSLNSSLKQIDEVISEFWIQDWIYFTTDKVLIQNDVVTTYKGLHLPVEVLKKIYYDNAIRMYPELGQQH